MMKEFLKKLKLVDHFTTTLQMTKTAFVEKLSSITDEGSTGIFASSFDAFSSSKNEFKGDVNYDGFKLRRKRRFFDTNMSLAVANGTLSEHNGQLTVETEINGFNNFFIFYYIFLLIFYGIMSFGFGNSENNAGFIALPFLLLHGAFMCLIPYFIMRRGVKRLKYELERDLFYLTKNT